MTRVYCLGRLLELGPLDRDEILSITGWNYNQVRGTLVRLMDAGIVESYRILGKKRRLYLRVNNT